MSLENLGKWGGSNPIVLGWGGDNGGNGGCDWELAMRGARSAMAGGCGLIIRFEFVASFYM